MSLLTSILSMRGTCASLFSGAGGWEVGAWAEGLRPLFGVEFNPLKREVLDRNFPEADHSVTDVRSAVPAGTPAPDVLFVSPPCQSFSRSRRKGTGTVQLASRGDERLGLEALRWVAALQPGVVAFENVPEYMAHEVWEELAAGMRVHGYMGEAHVVSCANYQSAADLPAHGTSRRRMLAVFSFGGTRGFPREGVTHDGGWGVCTADAGVDLTTLPLGRPLAPWQLASIKALPPRRQDYPLLVVGGNPTYRTLANGERVRKAWYGANELAPTLVPGTDTAKNMSGHRIVLNEGTQPRRFTARLGAVLQGFPLSYKLPEDEALAHSLVGNSVPPNLGAAVARLVQGR